MAHPKSCAIDNPRLTKISRNIQVVLLLRPQSASRPSHLATAADPLPPPPPPAQSWCSGDGRTQRPSSSARASSTQVGLLLPLRVLELLALALSLVTPSSGTGSRGCFLSSSSRRRG